MDNLKAHGIFFSLVLDIMRQSKAITSLLNSINEFDVSADEARKDVERFTPPGWNETRGIRTNIPDALIQAQVDASYLEEAKAIYAATAFVTLNSWIQTVGNRLEVEQNEYLSTGRQINGIYLARIIWAASNNFRHYDEWHPTTNLGKPAASITPLEAIGVGAPWNRNVCSDVFKILNFRTQFIDLFNEDIAPIGHQIYRKSTGMNFWLKEFTYGWGD